MSSSAHTSHPPSSAAHWSRRSSCGERCTSSRRATTGRSLRHAVPLGTDYWPPAYEKLLPKRRIAEIARSTIAELHEGPHTFAEVRELLQPYATDRISTTFLWRRVQGQQQVVHVPPSGTWGYHSDGVYRAADAALRGGLPDPAAAREHLVRRYLAAFGPATAQDVAQWAGVQRTGGITQTLAGMTLRTVRDEHGKRLYDLPRARLPDPETPAPPRLTPRFDNLVLSHADRTRVLGEVPVARIVTKNALVHATILVDGFVAGTWQLEKGRVPPRAVLTPSAGGHGRAAGRSRADRGVRRGLA